MTTGRIQVANNKGTQLLKLIGEVRLTLCATLETFVDKLLANTRFHSIIVDLSAADTIDSTSLGLLARMAIQASKQFNLIPILVSTQDDITRMLLSMGFDKLFIIVRELEQRMPFDNVCELPCEEDYEQTLGTTVLDAHRTLIDLNQGNHRAFSGLVEQLKRANHAHRNTQAHYGA